MRGGAIPLIVWGILLLILFAIGVVWESQGRVIHAALTGFALVSIIVIVAALVAMDRRSLRRGPPELRREPEALPRISLAAAGIGVSIGVILYGLEFGHFLVFLGAGLLVLCAGRLGQELVWQARSLNAVRRRQRRQ
jgi:chromate transport protein ChrA